MGKFIDLTGQRIGKLTVKNRAENAGITVRWACVCECGKEIVARSQDLRTGGQYSCGCTKYGRRTHGMAGTPLYAVWRSMLGRCYLPSNTSYERYGAVGVTVCDEWRSAFEPFMAWAIESGYQKGLQLDRINTYGRYEPANCRFVTAKENSNNRRPRRWWKKPQAEATA